MTGTLSVREYSIGVHLGCTAHEREKPQEVRVSLTLRFQTLPMACESDRLSDTVCYAKLCEIVRDASEQKHFETVEHLGWRIHEALKGLPSARVCRVVIHKVRPPIEDLRGGVRFELAEEA